MNIRLAVLFASAAFLTQPVAAQQPQSATSKPQMTKPATSNADSQFLKKVTEDNLAEVELATLANGKSQNEQVKAYASELLTDHQDLLETISGVLIIALGVLFVASFFVTKLNREWHVDGLMQRAGKGGPLVAGAAFAFAWTPCIGPSLAAILTAAANASSTAGGALLLAVYSAGLAVPFLLTAVAFTRMTTAFSVVKRHYGVIIMIGGVVLIAMGVLILTGELSRINIEMQRWTTDLGISV